MVAITIDDLAVVSESLPKARKSKSFGRVARRSPLYIVLLAVAACQSTPSGSKIETDGPSRPVAQFSDTGRVDRCYGENNHGIEVVMPENAPSVLSDFKAKWDIPCKYKRIEYPDVKDESHLGSDHAGAGLNALAAADGKVLYVEPRKCSKSNEKNVHVAISHTSWNYVGDKIMTVISVYAHLDKDSVQVKKGDKVERGQKLGEIGYACDFKPHLHFEAYDGRKFRFGGTEALRTIIEPEDIKDFFNPHELWMAGKGKVDCFDSEKIYQPGKMGVQIKFTYPVQCVQPAKPVTQHAQ